MSKMNLNEEFGKLIMLGKSWGMSETEIKKCLEEGVVKDPQQSNSTCQWLLHGVIRVAKFVSIFLIVFILAIVGGYILLTTTASLSPEIELVVGQIAGPYVYGFLRNARMLSSTFNFNFAAYYSTDCIVDNPYYVDPISDCNVCKDKENFSELSSRQLKKQQKFVVEMTPFVIRNYSLPVDYSTIQKTYLNLESRFDTSGIFNFQTNLKPANNFSDVIKNFDAAALTTANKGTVHVEWATNSVPTAQAIRKLFPRPRFVPDTSEVALLKTIYIDGSLSGAYEMPMGGFANIWYQQGSGTRRITLRPHIKCQTECKELSTVMSPGDLVFFQDQYWRLVSTYPDTQFQNQLSISFTGAFSL